MAIVRPLHLAVILLAVIFILIGAKAHPSNTVVLILSIVAVVLTVLDLVLPLQRRPVS